MTRTREITRIGTETWSVTPSRLGPHGVFTAGARREGTDPTGYLQLRAQGNDDLAALADEALSAGFDGVSSWDITPTGPALAALAARPLRALSLGNADLTGHEYDPLGACQSLEALSLQGSFVEDGSLHALAELRELRWLSLSNTNVTSEGLFALSALSALEGLALDAGVHRRGQPGVRLCDRAIPALRKLQGLRVLETYRAALSGPAMRALIEGLPSLERLDLRHQSLGPRTLDALLRAPSLRFLSLPPETDDATLEALTRCPLLEGLDLQSCTRVTDRGISALAALPTLRTLQMYCLQQLTPLALEPLRGSALRSLGVAWMPLEDRHVELLASMPSLEHLDVRRTQLSPEGLAQLKALRPSLVVSR
jgi:hypothetical protein